MALFVVWAALHYQILLLPTFRPSLVMVRHSSVVDVYNAPKSGEMQPDGAEVQWRLRW